MIPRQRFRSAYMVPRRNQFWGVKTAGGHVDLVWQIGVKECELRAAIWTEASCTPSARSKAFRRAASEPEFLPLHGEACHKRCRSRPSAIVAVTDGRVEWLASDLIANISTETTARQHVCLHHHSPKSTGADIMC